MTVCRTAMALLCLVSAAEPALSDSPTSQFETAQLDLRSGNYSEALETFSDLRRRYPRDVDYALGRSQALERLGRDREALTELDQALDLAPNYEDVWRLKHALLSRQKSKEDRLRLDTLRAAAATRFPHSAWWHAPARESRWTVLVGAGYDSLTNRLPSWNNQFVEISRERSQHDRVGLELTRSQRYSENDFGITARYLRHFDGWFAGGALGIGNDPLFQPRTTFEAHGGRALDRGWVTSLGYRYKDYRSATVSSLFGTVEKYHGSFRFAYTLTASRLHDASNFNNHAAAVDWYASDSRSYRLSLSTGNEAEVLENGEVLKTGVQSVSIGGRHALSERLSVQWWIGTHEQGRFYRRNFLGMAVSIGI